MTNNQSEFPVNSLDYDGIRDNLVSFLQNQRDSKGSLVYQDYNFIASGISTIVNLLAYHGHYLGYYVKMLLNESFIDSAVLKESLMSKAKLNGYIPRGRRSSRAELKLSVDVDINNQPSSKKVLIPKGASFSGANTNQDQRVFYTIDDVYVDNVSYSTPGIARYTSNDILVYEGKLSEWKFKVDTSLINQRFIIDDSNIDIDTIRINVFTPGASNNAGEEFKLAKTSLTVDSTSAVYYISTNENGRYELIFGNGIFGKALMNQSLIVVRYISTNGESGNGCKVFVFNKPTQDIPTENNIGNWEDFIVTLKDNSPSSGGVDAESIESMRFGIPYHYRRQERLVNEDDFKTILLNEFRNIDSINVWGGETNYIKDYGKVYISIKPKFANSLTMSAKRDIKNRILSQYTVVGTEPVFVDPEFIDVDLIVYSKVDLKKTNRSVGEIDKDINGVINTYNSTYLNVFDNFFSNAQLMSLILKNPIVKSCFSKQVMRKTTTILYNSTVENALFFGNPIQKGLTSSTFVYGQHTCEYRDDNGKLYIHNTLTNNKVVTSPQGSVNYDEGIIRFYFPEFAKVSVGDINSSGVIEFKAIPQNPDILSFENNIVRISKITTITS